MPRFELSLLLRRAARPALALWLAPLLLLVSSARLRADITIKFDDLKDGDKISDVAPIIVRADSGDGIDKVEFAVDDQLRFSSGSSPYTFKWDTIADTEGAHSLAVTAIDANGTKKTVKLNLMIDNQLSLGAPALAAKAREGLAAGDMDTAMKYSRRALKADPDNTDAARALAAIEAHRDEWDKAIGTLDKAKELSKSVQGMLELASYRMRRAVLPENAANLVSDIDAASTLRRKAADLAIENLKARNLPGDEARSHEMLGDAYTDAARYREAIQEYSKSSGSGALTSVNRVALAYVLNGQAPEALVLLRPIIKEKTGDAATRAVLGLALLRSRRFAEARDAVRTDLGGSHPASDIVAAYADAVLQKQPASLQEAKDAADARPNLGEAHYALSMGLVRLVDSEAEVVKAMAMSPFQSGPMVDYACRIALSADHADKYPTALRLLQTVLTRDPDDEAAQIAKVLLLLHTNRVAEAEPELAALVKRDPESADVQVLAAIYFDIKGNPTATGERLKLARKYDPDTFDLGIAPKPIVFLYQEFRKAHYRADFYLSPECLYPAKPVASAAP